MDYCEKYAEMSILHQALNLMEAVASVDPGLGLSTHLVCWKIRDGNNWNIITLKLKLLD